MGCRAPRDEGSSSRPLGGCFLVSPVERSGFWGSPGNFWEPLDLSLSNLAVFCASFFPFFALSTPPFLRQFSSPRAPPSGTSDPVFLAEKRQFAGAGFGGRFWTGATNKKKRKILFSGARKRESFESTAREVLGKLLGSF